MYERALVIGTSLTLLGCASIAPTPGPKEAYFKQHYVLAHEDGFAMSADRRVFRHRVLTRDEAARDIDGRILEGVEHHARRLWPDLRPGATYNRTLQLLVFVHGGLNGYGDDFVRMREMLAIPDDCTTGREATKLFASVECSNALTGYYPIFVNWNSELWDSIRDDLFLIRRGSRQQAIGLLTWPFVLSARLTEAVFSAPYSWFGNVEDFVNANPEGPDWAEGTLSFLPRAFATPVVKAFGTSAWQIMKRRAALVASPQFANREYEGVAFTLFRQISARLDSDGYFTMTNPLGARVRLSITLVGHSMGAIVINRVLAESIHLARQLPIAGILYLAPALSIRDVAVTNLFRLRYPGARFWTFALRRADEAWERHWISPRGTLLVWIDSYFEAFTEVADATYGRTDNFRARYNVYGKWQAPHGTEPFNMCEWATDDRPVSHHAIGDSKYVATALSYVGREVFRTVPLPPVGDGTIVCANFPIAEGPTVSGVAEEPLDNR